MPSMFRDKLRAPLPLLGTLPVVRMSQALPPLPRPHPLRLFFLPHRFLRRLTLRASHTRLRSSMNYMRFAHLKGSLTGENMISLVQPLPMPTCQECHLPGSSSLRLSRCPRLRLSLPWITVLFHTEGWYSTCNLAVAAFVCLM